MPKAWRTPALIRASTISSPPVREGGPVGPAAPSVGGAGPVVAIGSSPLRSGSGYTTDPAPPPPRPSDVQRRMTGGPRPVGAGPRGTSDVGPRTGAGSGGGVRRRGQAGRG